MRRTILYIYTWAMAMFFGSILSETVLLYPNIFRDVPASLSVSMDFMKVLGPGHFFPKVGGAILVLTMITIILHIKEKAVLKYLVLSFVLMIVFEFLFSILYFWPRNNIMFVEGLAKHSAEELQKAANEFQMGHWIRLSVSFINSCIAMAALHRVHYRQHSYIRYSGSAER